MKDQQDSTRTFKPKWKRSSNYPNITLKVAVDRAAALYKKAVTHFVPLQYAADIWKQSVKSSSFLKVIGALGAYGLVDFQGTAERREVGVSKAGERIVERGLDWESYLRNAARAPKPFQKILDKFAVHGHLPAKDLLVEKLKWDDDFQLYSKDAIGRLVTVLFESFDYAKLSDSAILPHPQPQEGGGEEEIEEDEEAPLQVGDYVQWTINEMDQFNPPAEIKRFSPDGKWAFFDSTITNTGAPIEQLSKRASLSSSASPADPPSPSSRSISPTQRGGENMKQYVIPVNDSGGDVVLLMPQNMTADMYERLTDVLKVFKKAHVPGDNTTTSSEQGDEGAN